ncbi:endonuclease domain-containing protein [candidate division WOR-3 bacterium]|nr:endonuclease domain-containing protein [candidate division WOR-3 bacterium]
MTNRARRLRRESTDAERLLWRHLRNRKLAGARFRRQHPVGPYVVDFCSPGARLIIEVDGGQHAERTEYDSRRERHLAGHGFRVLRFWNNEVLQQTEAVLVAIASALSPHLNPLPGGERKERPHDRRYAPPLPEEGESQGESQQ